MKFLIVGSFREEEEEIRRGENPRTFDFQAFKDSCRSLGKTLAADGATIYVGSDRDVDADTYCG